MKDNVRRHRIKQITKLGIDPSKARNILIKNLLFHFAQQLNLDTCYRCHKKILSADELTIEHKVGWLNSPHPIEYYFDLENIAFSHPICNARNDNSGRYNIRKNKTGYRGVSKIKNRKSPYKAHIKINKHDTCLGYFGSPIEAAKCYDEAAKKQFGDKAILNFPI